MHCQNCDSRTCTLIRWVVFGTSSAWLIGIGSSSSCSGSSLASDWLTVYQGPIMRHCLVTPVSQFPEQMPSSIWSLAQFGRKRRSKVKVDDEQHRLRCVDWDLTEVSLNNKDSCTIATMPFYHLAKNAGSIRACIIGSGMAVRRLSPPAALSRSCHSHTGTLI